MAMIIDAVKCPQNHVCPLIKICPLEAISQNGIGLPEIDSDVCVECGECAVHCGMQAIYAD